MKKKFLAFVNRRYAHTFGVSCGAEELAAVDFNTCDPEVKLSEIQRVFLAKIGAAPFTDWTQPEEWQTRMSETSTDDDAIRPMTVIGDKPAPATTKKDISSGRKVVTRKDHTINATVDEVTEDNHLFLQSVESGKRYKMWYETAGGLMFGGNNGIIIEISGDMVLNRGGGEIMAYQYVITWVAQTTESRCQSPIFGETILGDVMLDTLIDFTASGTPVNGSSSFNLVGGANAVAKFAYNDINPTIGAALVCVIKVGGVTKLTVTTTSDFDGGAFTFTDILGGVHQGFFTNGNVLF